jgi:linoleate 10R-lipoxygenase
MLAPFRVSSSKSNVEIGLIQAAMTIQPGALPDEGLIFDSLFARQKFNPSPNKVSSIFFDWASLIIHGRRSIDRIWDRQIKHATDLFQTDHRDFSISQTSSYLDLSILYGDVQEDQDQIRTFKDGKLKPDCFSEARLLAFPPACGVMLIMLNRYALPLLAGPTANALRIPQRCCGTAGGNQ